MTRKRLAKLPPDEKIGRVLKHYIACHEDELRAFPEWFGEIYEGTWDSHFRKIAGRQMWKLRRDLPFNTFTANLIYRAEALGLPETDKGTSVCLGLSADKDLFWLPFLDGGLYVKFILREGQKDNRLTASQSTLISGKQAFRYLLSILGITPPKASKDADAAADELLIRQKCQGSPERAALSHERRPREIGPEAKL